MSNLVVSGPIDSFMQATTQAGMFHSTVPFATIDTSSSTLDLTGVFLATGSVSSLYCHVLSSHAAQNTIQVINLDGFSTANNFYSAIACTDPNSQSQTTFGYGNDTDALLPWRRNGYIEMWCGPSGTAPLPGYVVVQTPASGSSVIRHQILSTGTDPGDQIFFTSAGAEQLRLVASSANTTLGGASDSGARLTVGGSTGGVNSTLAFNGATSAPALSTKPGLYHRSGVGLGVYADANISFEVNGQSSLAEVFRLVSNGRAAFWNTNPSTDFTIGAIGVVKEAVIGLNDSFAHFREIDSANAIGITTNINNINAIDDVSLPSWKMRMGSAGFDNFIIARAAPGSTSFSTFLTITSTGGIIFPSLPTSDPHVAGEMWNNLGIATISAG